MIDSIRSLQSSFVNRDSVVEEFCVGFVYRCHRVLGIACVTTGTDAMFVASLVPV